MNIYAIIILAALLIEYVLDLVADLLNIRHSETEVPEEFEDVYSADKYEKSQLYLRDRTRFGIITSTFSVVVLLVFWFAGGFNWLDLYLRQFIDAYIWRGLAYIGALIIAQSVISLPFGIYSTFVIEEKYGFNKTTPKTFAFDILKSLAMTVVIGGSVLALILFILREAGGYAWLYGWTAALLISVILQYVAPRWIMPLFNKFEPLEEGELRDKIFDYAEKVDFPLKNIYVMDGSKRSSKSNAFFTGFGRNKRIVLFDTLIERHQPDELVAVLAHEIGHFKKKHLHLNMIISFVHMGIIFFLLQMFLSFEGLYEAFYMQYTPIYAGLLFFGMLYAPVESILSIIMNYISRKNELQADKFAAQTIENSGNLAAALKKLARNNLSNLRPHPFYVFMNYSHPPVAKRIQLIQKY
jgi:STE24 endopeptidase